MAEDYCDLCDLPLSQCVHGMPKPPPPEPRPAAAPRARSPRSAPTTAGPAGAPARAASRPSAAPVRPPSRRTDQSAFRPHIVAILREEGRLETEEMLLELEIRMEDALLERDREPAPTGETRWHATARAERKAMIDEGLLVGGQPGLWALTDRGRLVSY